MAAGEEITGYLLDLIALRRAQPEDDLLSGMIEASDCGDRLTESEVIANTLLIYAAGFETTTHLLGNTVRALVAHPRAAPNSAPRPIADLLRDRGSSSL